MLGTACLIYTIDHKNSSRRKLRRERCFAQLRLHIKEKRGYKNEKAGEQKGSVHIYQHDSQHREQLYITWDT